MQIACWEMPWFRALRAVALVLAVVLGLEWTVPLGGYAESNMAPASAPATRVGNQDLPPTHEAESVQVEPPFYKKWWFWTIVVIAVVVSAVVIAAANSDGDVPIGGPPTP